MRYKLLLIPTELFFYADIPIVATVVFDPIDLDFFSFNGGWEKMNSL